MDWMDDKRAILKEIDPDFDISFDVNSEQHLIYHKGYLFQNVPFGGFTRELVDHIRKMVWINKNGNIIEEVDKENEKVDKMKEKQIEDMAYNMAKDIRKPLIKEVYGI